jgi:magnesium chelatase family protein
MLARRLKTIFPPRALEDATESTSVWTVAGLFSSGHGLLRERPFWAVHHTTWGSGLIGSGTVPHLGEASLAHLGVLFLEELPDFSERVLESLRQPLEDGSVIVSRAAGSAAFSARFQLVGAANPCRRSCVSLEACVCTAGEKRQ